MALNFFRQRDIERMDVNDIPEEFINYFDTLDNAAKETLIGTRPELAKALGFVLPETVSESDADTPNIKIEPFSNIQEEEVSQDDIVEEAAVDELEMVQKNFYAGKDLDSILKNNMPELEALAIPDGALTCVLHRKPFENKQINYRNAVTGATYGMILRVCRDCHRVFLEESKMIPIHQALIARNIPHTFYDLELSTQFLRSQMPPYEFSETDFLMIPDTWVEEDPICPIHDEPLYEVPCFKKYKDREIHFVGYMCERCGKYLMRRSSALDLMDRCAESGIPQIKTERLVKKQPLKTPVLPREIESDYLIENGRRKPFRYNVTTKCYRLSEADTVIVSDSIYCTLEDHESTEEVVALILVLQKRGGKKSYLFHLGYCNDCQKFYMAQEDYKVLYSFGRPEVSILLDIDDTDYHITSGEIFNLERDHLGNVEEQISNEVASIRSSSDYVNPYSTGDYDDGNLSYAKYRSKNKYGKRLEQLSGYISKPYTYRVDISLDHVTETYYIGASDIYLDGKQQVISANSDFGHNLINYQTIKVRKDGKEYKIKLSRQFEIDNALLYGYTNLRTDEDIIFRSGITDPFLVRVLNMRKRQHNLTDIFVTIQENQNRIVNTPFSRPIIVQGCAGSGKTMVLLHRLSSLNYKERGFRFDRDALILTPNDQFSLHIRGIAEELQISNVQRASVEQYYIDTLLLYSPEFKLDTKLSSEMIVSQNYVDFIYSDQFRDSFLKAYDFIIDKRNSLLLTLNDLLKAMGQPERKIDLSDDSRVIGSIKTVLDAVRGLVKQKELDVESATNEQKKVIARKNFLEDRLRSLRESSASFMNESLQRVKSEIDGLYIARQETILELEKQIRELNEEKEGVQKKLLLFGKREKTEALNKQIASAEQRLAAVNKQLENELPVLSMSTEDFSEEEALSWIRQIMLIIPNVQEELRRYKDLQEETQRFHDELAGIDNLIETANKKVEERIASQYSDEAKRVLMYLYSEIDKYQMLKTFQQIFDKTVDEFREENNISNIQGKYHRYDLYARLLFSMRYFGKALGSTRFMCIDEGQDLALNEYRLIYDLNQKKVIFNVFGDTNQLIKSGRGISDWSALETLFRAEVYELNENYRNTNQITRFCNSSFDMKVTQTGVDGPNVREIPRKELEEELAAINITSERIAILVPRNVQKNLYLKKDLLPSSVSGVIGDRMENGFIALMYVDEVKGIEFDKAYVVGNRMSRNERYIAYTRALSELILVIDEQIPVFNHSEDDEKTDRRKPRRQQTTHKKAKTGILNYSASQNKQAQDSTSTIAGQKSSNGKNEYNSPNSDIKGQESTVALGNENITETSPLISTALKELPKGSIEMTAVGALTGKYHLVPYSGKLRNFTSKKATSMYTPQIRAGKRTKVPVSIIDESHLIFITKDLFKLYEKAFKSSSEIEIVL